MARQSAQLLRTVQILALGLLGLLLSTGIVHATPDSLIQQGFSQFYAGQFSQALQTWQQAEQSYRREKDAIGISGSLVNQSLAQQAIGQHRTACYSAAKAIEVDRRICQSPGNTEVLSQRAKRPTSPLALKALGDSLSGLGYWDEAEIVLKQALTEENRADLWHSLGEVYTRSEQIPEAIVAYQTAIQLAQQQPQVLANAKIDLLKLRPPTERDIQAIDLSAFPGILKAQAQLKIADTLRESQPQIALQQAQAALAIGQSLQHPRTEAAALYLIGKIRYHLGQTDISSLQQATALAQSIRAWDLAYPAQGLLAQIWQQQQNSDLAQIAYQSTIQSIKQLRQQLKGNASRVQTDFYEQVKPIYRNYLEILFQKRDRLSEIIEVSTALQVAELENFLGCQLNDWQPIANIQQTAQTTLVFVVRGVEHYQVIIRTPGAQDYAYLADTKELEASSFNFLANVRVGNLLNLEPEIISNYGKNLYEVLLKPGKKYLPKQGTIAFVLDPALQNIPIDFLHDGQNYLIEKYSLSLTLGAQIRQPKVMKHLKVLLAGVSEVAPSFGAQFPPLTEVEAEFSQIHSALGGKVLLNQDFTIAQLKAAIATGKFPIVHLASHGSFSSDAKNTGIFTWDSKLDMPTLRQLIDELGKHQQSIELLVLSACETAKGDERSILGLAGVAAQAGARSTLASLWLVNDQSTAALMDEFYRGIKNGLSKAEALRRAKLSLIKNPEFSHPFFWGSFQLIGSWL